jgi:hypothetical protein
LFTRQFSHCKQVCTTTVGVLLVVAALPSALLRAISFVRCRYTFCIIGE